MNLTTDVELAEALGITVEDVREGCRTKRWPCVRPKRSVWRFTDAQIEQIVAMQTRGSGKQSAPVAGIAQTPRSAARSRRSA